MRCTRSFTFRCGRWPLPPPRCASEAGGCRTDGQVIRSVSDGEPGRPASSHPARLSPCMTEWPIGLRVHSHRAAHHRRADNVDGYRCAYNWRARCVGPRHASSSVQSVAVPLIRGASRGVHCACREHLAFSVEFQAADQFMALSHACGKCRSKPGAPLNVAVYVHMRSSSDYHNEP